jgi:hypothetical protein
LAEQFNSFLRLLHLVGGFVRVDDLYKESSINGDGDVVLGNGSLFIYEYSFLLECLLICNSVEDGNEEI